MIKECDLGLLIALVKDFIAEYQVLKEKAGVFGKSDYDEQAIIKINSILDDLTLTIIERSNNE